DLQLVHPAAEQRGERDLSAGEDRGATVEQLLALGLAGHGAARLAPERHAVAPISARWVRPRAKLATGKIAIVSTVRNIVVRRSKKLSWTRQCRAHSASIAAAPRRVKPVHTNGKVRLMK